MIPTTIQQVYQRSTCLYSAKEVDAALDKMATDIHHVLAETNPVLLCVMIGGLVLVGNLLPRLNFPLSLDYVHATRYRGDTRGTDLHWKVTPQCSLSGRTVLVLDDILDGGVTLTEILRYCEEQGAERVYSGVLVDKQAPRITGAVMAADFTALTVPNRYVFGYGMDYREYLRNAPGIYQVAVEDE